MPGMSEVLRIQTDFRGAQLQDVGRPAPRIMLISDTAAGPLGLNSPTIGMSMRDVISTYSDGTPSYAIDWVRAYYSSRFEGKGPSPVDVYRVGSGGTKAVSPTLYADNTIGWGVDDWGTGVPSTDPIGFFEADGVGDVTFDVDLIPVQKIVSGHPAGANITVFDVRVHSPSGAFPAITYQRVVFTNPDATGDSSSYRTVDAATILNSPTRRPAIVRWVYEPFYTAGLNPDLADGTGTLSVTGGTAPTVSAADWQAAFDTVRTIPNRWHVIPNPPDESTRTAYVNTLRDGDSVLVHVAQMYGEDPTTFATARDAYGDGEGSSSVVTFFGWGTHPLANGREVNASALYLGRWAAKINRSGFGTSYPVGNENLGFSSVAAGDELNQSQQEQFSNLNINYIKKFDDGTIGVHGFWTLDRDLTRLGDLFRRHSWNDIIIKLTQAYKRMAQNRGNTPFTRADVNRLGDLQIRPYFERGFARRAQTGTFYYEEIQQRYPDLNLDNLNGWIYYLAGIQLNGTLGGIYVYLTNQQIEGLTEVFNEATDAQDNTGEEVN